MSGILDTVAGSVLGCQAVWDTMGSEGLGLCSGGAGGR